MTTSRFCPNCGAANAPAHTLCHACQQPLIIPANGQEASTLLNERYAVLAEVGSGGFGAVYRARDTREQDRIVAIKQINLKGLSPQEIIEATDGFNREAQILTTLSHPLLPSIFDRFSDSEHWYLVMNFIEGSTLDDYLQQHAASALPARTGLPLEETLIIGLQLCNVLHYLHTQQPPVIFRDIKPGNIMRTPRGKLYLIDFGIARHFKPGQARDTIPFGSPGFAAPEQYGRAQTSPQADIYSLGALLYCLISGDDPAEHPFQFPSLRLYGIDGIRELDALIQHMVALDVALRPASIQDVRAELQRIQQIYVQANKQHIWQPPQGQTPPAASVFAQQHLFSSALSARKTSRRRVVTAALAVGGAVLIGGAATAFSNIQSSVTSITASYQSGVGQTAAVPPDGVTYWSPDLSHAAVVNNQLGEAQIYEVENSQALQVLKPIPNTSNLAIVWSPDNRSLCLLSDISDAQLWDVQTGHLISTFSQFLPTVLTSIPVAWSPNRKYLANGYIHSNLDSNITDFTLLQARDGTQIYKQSFPGQAVTALAWSPNSRYVAFPDLDTSLSDSTFWSAEIWDSFTRKKAGSLRGQLPSGPPNQISAMAWSPRSNKLAFFIGNDIWLSDVAQRASATQLTNNYLGSPTPTSNLLWSPNEQYLAILLNEGLTIWDTNSGQQVQVSNNGDPSSNLAAFAWSADSRSVTVVDNDNIISKWPVG